VAAAPAPLAGIRDKVRADWIEGQATQRARAAAQAIAAKTASGASLADAVKQAGVALPGVQPLAARRIQIATASGEVPPAMRTLFTLGRGKSRMVPDPQRRAFYVVKVSKITPGNAVLQPALIGRMQGDLQQALAQDYGNQFINAIRDEMKVKRNESAIAAEKARITTSGG
jgi:peptidyl-prolyl cis-trans isomerase D